MPLYYTTEDPVGYLRWIRDLQEDALRNGCSSRFKAASEGVWIRVWLESVEPTIEAVVEWALRDPQRFADLRQSETEHSKRIAA
jgi:hypothetical protein